MDKIELQGPSSRRSFLFCDYREVNVYLRGLLTIAVSIREVQMGRVNIFVFFVAGKDMWLRLVVNEVCTKGFSPMEPD